MMFRHRNTSIESVYGLRTLQLLSDIMALGTGIFCHYRFLEGECLEEY